MRLEIPPLSARRGSYALVKKALALGRKAPLLLAVRRLAGWLDARVPPVKFLSSSKDMEGALGRACEEGIELVNPAKWPGDASLYYRTMIHELAHWAAFTHKERSCERTERRWIKGVLDKR